MNQEERRLYLIRALQREMPQYGKGADSGERRGTVAASAVAV